jgi:DNA-binding response OmpR family regulator
MSASGHRLIDGAPTEPQPAQVAPRVGVVRHVAVVEPDAGLRRTIAATLERDGCHVTELCDGESLLALVAHHRPDLVITDLDLPVLSGLELVRRLFSSGRLPTVVLASSHSETDLVVTLEMGADDYIEKPFTQRELLARVHAVLRRVEHGVDGRPLRFDGLTIDPATREVVVGDTPVELTTLEFDLLAFLAASPRQVFSQETLLDRVWGSSGEWQTTATVSEHIHRLRRKIEPDPSKPRWIQTLRGAGYRFVP